MGTDPAKHHANDPKCVCSGPIFDVSSAEGQCISGNYDMGTVLRQKVHTIHVELSVPTSFNSQSRQWILNLGQWNTGAHHWIWNSNSQIQFGRWNGEQIQTFDIRVCNSLTMVVEPSTQMKLFCKGQLVATHQGSVPFDVQNANLAVASNPQEQGFTGCVKQVKIWSRALTYSEVQQQVSTDTDTTCRACPSGTIQYPGTHRCFERKWSGFVCNLDPATDPAKHHANDRKCVCSAFTTSTTQTPTSNPTRTPTRDPTGSPTKMPTSNPTRNPTASPTSASDTTCHICPSGSIQYPGTHRCFARKWSGFLCNLDPATDPAKHHANDPKCVCNSGLIYRVSNNVLTGWRPRVDKVHVYSDSTCTTEIDATFEGSSGGYSSATDGSKAFDGSDSNHWRPQCHPCAIGEAWLSFSVSVEIKCVEALYLGEGSGGSETWNGGIKVEKQNSDGTWTTEMESTNGNSANISGDSDTTCRTCPSGTIKYPGTHRCFARKWSGFLCNLDPATDPAKHHANDPKCVCSATSSPTATPTLTPTSNPSQSPT